MDEKTPLVGGSSGQGPPPGPYPQQGGAPPYPQQGGAPAYPQQGGAPPYPQQGGAPPYPPQGSNAGPYATGGPGPSYQGGPPPKGDLPPDMPEGMDPSKLDSEPSAPPLDLMDQLPGYNNIGFEAAPLPPPSYDEAVREPPERAPIQGAAAITESDARDAILQHVSEHCCYGKGPAEQMKLGDIQPSSAFHYTLETFGEARSTKWTCEPYRGEGLTVTGPPPSPWDIQATASKMFQNSKLNVEVPNTASVKPCHHCNARGYRTCSFCFGTGRSRCGSCGGSGRQSHYEDGRHVHRSCTFCQGGWKFCYSCNGSGQRRCNKCEGRGNLRWFILLTITWTNHMSDHIVERTALPDELIRNVTGEIAFTETSPRVWPVNHFPEQDINTASNGLVTRHSSQFPNERILMQRHQVRIIPVNQVAYKYKDQSSSFFVYGFEHKVYAPDYPAKCCCGCNVL